MPLPHILEAVAAEADAQIAAAKAARDQEASELRRRHEDALAEKRRAIADAAEREQHYLRRSAEMQAMSAWRGAILQRKRQLLDRFYDELLESLAKLPEAEAEPLLRACLEIVREKGTIHPAHAHAGILKKLAEPPLAVGKPVDGKGGFLFTSDSREQNCTFEYLVSQVLRPQTELAVSSQLFGSPHA